MIPPFDHNYVLPPYVGDNPTQRAAQSPYHTYIMDLCKHFGTTRSRVDILKGFIQFRLEACSLPAIAFVVDGVIEISPITNIGMSLQYCFNHMSRSISNRLYNVDAEKLYWKTWDICHSSGFEAPAYDRRRKLASRLLWRSYCNGCEKAAELLKTTLTQYPELKNVWSENLFQ